MTTPEICLGVVLHTQKQRKTRKMKILKRILLIILGIFIAILIGYMVFTGKQI